MTAKGLDLVSEWTQLADFNQRRSPAKLRYQVIALGREQGSVEESISGQLGTQSLAGSSGGAPGRRTSSILSYLDLPTRSPPLSPARAPRAPREAWSGIFEFDQIGPA